MIKCFPLCFGLARSLLWPFAAPCGGAENLPLGPALIAANHVSFLDGLILAQQYAWARGRPLHLIAYAEPFAHPLYGYVLRTGQCVALDRRDPDGPRRMMSSALAWLDAGEAVGMFPEGHLGRGDGRLGRARDGMALLALESGAPVVPSGLRGARRVWPRKNRWPRPAWGGRRMRWHIGRPLDFSAESARYRRAGPEERGRLVEEVNARTMAAVAELSGASQFSNT